MSTLNCSIEGRTGSLIVVAEKSQDTKQKYAVWAVNAFLRGGWENLTNHEGLPSRFGKIHASKKRKKWLRHINRTILADAMLDERVAKELADVFSKSCKRNDWFWVENLDRGRNFGDIWRDLLSWLVVTLPGSEIAVALWRKNLSHRGWNSHETKDSSDH